MNTAEFWAKVSNDVAEMSGRAAESWDEPGAVVFQTEFFDDAIVIRKPTPGERQPRRTPEMAFDLAKRIVSGESLKFFAGAVTKRPKVDSGEAHTATYGLTI